jgi:hypothetical protein
MVSILARPKTLRPIFFLSTLVACSEPKDPFDAFMELEDHETKIERDIFKLASERLERIKTECIDLDEGQENRRSHQGHAKQTFSETSYQSKKR